MSNRIVFIQGSPRKNGNTRAVTAMAMASAKEHGAEVAEIDVTNLNYTEPGCIGCQKCQESEAFICSLKDEVAETVATLPEYDVIVLATPIYWYSYSAQLKIFIDRTYSLAKVTDPGNYQFLLSGKAIALIVTAVGPIEENLELIESQARNAANIMGCSFLSCLFPNTPLEAGALSKDPSALKQATEFGRSLALAQ